MSRRATTCLGGLRVIVVEDDLLISQLIQEILLSLECAVVGPVRNLGDALRAIRTQDIDAALLDVHLGSTTIDPAANELALRHIPFILVTGQATLGECPALLAEAPTLLKPFKVRQLVDMMTSNFRLRDRAQPHHA